MRSLVALPVLTKDIGQLGARPFSLLLPAHQRADSTARLLS